MTLMTSCTTVLELYTVVQDVNWGDMYLFKGTLSWIAHDKIMEGCHAPELPSVRTQTTLQGRDLRGLT